VNETPQVIPWYRSAILKGILTSVCAQIIRAVADHFHIKSDTLGSLGIDPNSLADWIMNGMSGAALYYAAHARVVKPVPAVVLTKASADTANAASPPVAPPVFPPPAKPAQPSQVPPT
jgi:hypothetical protein